MPAIPPRRTHRSGYLFLAAALCVLALDIAFPSPAPAARPAVVVAPLELYSAPGLEEMAPGLQAVLASRMGGQGYVVVTGTGEETGPVVWTLRTTVTRLGSVYSLDAVLLPATVQAGEAQRTYETVNDTDALLPALERIAGRLRPHIRIPAGTAFGPTPSASPATLPATVAPSTATTLATTATGSLRDLDRVFGSHRAGSALEGAARGLVVVDVDGDGTTEVVVLMGEELVALHDQAGTFERLWIAATANGVETHALSAADVDGNGRPELFVAGVRRGVPHTQAYEWAGSALAPKGAALRAFARCPQHPGESALLLGQPRGPGDDFFTERAFRYHWQDGGYQKGDSYPVPEQALPLNVDWFNLQPGQPPQAVITTREERLEVHDSGGVALFETLDMVKGTNAFIDSDAYNAEGEVFRPNGRTLGWQDPASGDYFLVYFRNYSSFSRVLRRTPAFTHGNVVAARWDGLALETVATGPKLTGYISDIAAYETGGAVPRTVYIALTDSKGILSRKATTRIVAYDL